MMDRVLVTGGAGFIASRLVRVLLRKGVTVRVLDNFSSGRTDNLSDIAERVDVVEGDVRDAAACRGACDGIDTVFHLAALVSVPQSVADTVGSDAINSGGTLNMLVAARDCGARRLVFSSSAAVYGDVETVPVKETVPTYPTSPYGVQKLTSEHYARNFSLLFGLETVCLRYFNVYGPGQDPASPYAAAIPKFLMRLIRGESPTVFGDGEQTRDFCYVDDVVAANLCAESAPRETAQGSAYNIASGTRISINSLLPLIQERLGTSLPIRYEPEREGDIKHSGADISAAKQALGYHPVTSLVEGLRQTAEYYRTLVETS
jgi:nucleoside-diphosphate-sugar epimerase